MPPADNSRHLAEATRQRSADARRRALAAIEALTNDGQPVTPTTVARRGGVSRQWLYTSTDVMAAINTARAQPVDQAGRRSASPASVASLQRRLEAATDDNKRLRRRVTDLEAQIAALYGELRARQHRPAPDLTARPS